MSKTIHDDTMVDANKHGRRLHYQKHGTFSCRLVFVDIGFE